MTRTWITFDFLKYAPNRSLEATLGMPEPRKFNPQDIEPVDWQDGKPEDWQKQFDGYMDARFHEDIALELYEIDELRKSLKSMEFVCGHEGRVSWFEKNGYSVDDVFKDPKVPEDWHFVLEGHIKPIVNTEGWGISYHQDYPRAYKEVYKAFQKEKTSLTEFLKPKK